MTQAEGYRARTLMVRQAARQHLLEVRRQRLAKYGLVADTGLAETLGAGSDDGFAVSDTEPTFAASVDVSSVDDSQDVMLAELTSDDIESEPVDEISLRSVEGVPDHSPFVDPVEPVTAQAADAPMPFSQNDTEFEDPSESALKPDMKPAVRKTRRSKKPKESVGGEAENQSILEAAMQEIDDDLQIGSFQTVRRNAASSQLTVSCDSPPQVETMPDVVVPLDCETAVQDPLPAPTLADPPVQEAPVDASDEGSHAAACPVPEVVSGPEPAPFVNGLEALPGAGPGLIWMLGQIGITSIDDLAQADADILSRDLGLVGQILNVGSWIDSAQEIQKFNTRPT